MADEKPAKKTPARRRRKAGEPARDKAAAEQHESLDEPQADTLPDERIEWFRSPGFTRMRTSWQGEEATQMDRLQTQIEAQVYHTFADAYAIMDEIFEIVREHETDDQGQPLRDPNGWPVWKRTYSGAYVEHWDLLTYRHKEDFLHKIVTSLFDWEQRAGRAWTEAMFSKAYFTERFAVAYDEPMTGTIEDRTAVGNRKAAEDRYFALFMSSISRRGDAVVRTMSNISLRLRDTLSP